MARAAGSSSQPPGEDRLPSLSFARWRSLTSEWVLEPESEFSLILALLPCSYYRRREFRVRPHPLPDRLSGNPSRMRRLLEGATLRQPLEDRSISPIQVHCDVKLPRIPPGVDGGRGKPFPHGSPPQRISRALVGETSGELIRPPTRPRDPARGECKPRCARNSQRREGCNTL